MCRAFLFILFRIYINLCELSGVCLNENKSSLKTVIEEGDRKREIEGLTQIQFYLDYERQYHCTRKLFLATRTTREGWCIRLSKIIATGGDKALSVLNFTMYGDHNFYAFWLTDVLHRLGKVIGISKMLLMCALDKTTRCSVESAIHLLLSLSQVTPHPPKKSWMTTCDEQCVCGMLMEIGE